jgi:putative FmdB family regulatory protein
MPIYDYRCGQCGEVCEVFQRSQDEKPARCPSCGSESLERLVSTFSVLGSGLGEGSTCCGRDTPCESPPCSADDVCRRR